MSRLRRDLDEILKKKNKESLAKDFAQILPHKESLKIQPL